MRLTVAVLAALTLAGAAAVRSGDTGARTPPTTAPRVTIDDFSTGAKQWRQAHVSSARRTVAGEPVLTLRGGTLSRALPAGDSVSFDLRLSRGATAQLALGAAGSLAIRESRGRVIAGRTRLHRTLAPGGWYRLEAARGQVALDGQRVTAGAAAKTARLSIQATRGAIDLRALIAAPTAEPGDLLLQRLAWLHTRTPRGKQPIGTGLDRRLRFSRSWTRGFWPGSLWQAYDLTGSPMFKRWARQATSDNFGAEHADTHDLGFMYETSSARAYDHLCSTNANAPDCNAFRHSALTAANSLMKIAATNEAVGTIPTTGGRCTDCTGPEESETIIDSVMNLPLLFWATRVSGDTRYRDLAARHAHLVADRMVRSDGSTWAVMQNRRSDGAFIAFHTHQGYRDDSTWARGQAWAIHGFADAAAALNDTGLLDTAQRTARYVMARLPTPGVPLYDYDAPPSKPHDVSAGVITAAGMLRLASACETLGATCDPAPADLRAYAQKLLNASLAQIGRRPPLGFLGHQVYGLGGKSSWDDDAELTFGIDYALEALGGG